LTAITKITYRWYMALDEAGTAPYAPLRAVTGALDAYRDNGLAITAANLGRIGVQESIQPRTLQTFRILGLLDDEGNPTQALQDFKQASSDKYRERLAETLRAAYAPIFAVTGADPSTKSYEQVTDAFRTYSPDSLRDRMVKLFLGLCEYSGIITQAPGRKPGPKAPRAARTPAGPAGGGAPKRDQGGRKEHQPPPPPPSRGGTYSIELRSTGTVEVTYSADLWDLSPDDREFLFKLIDTVKGYEAKRELPPGSQNAVGEETTA
jgi:hypothetical protein